MKSSSFRIAELEFEILLPDDLSIERLLPSFENFHVPQVVSDPIFRFSASSVPIDIKVDEAQMIEISESDLGQVKLYNHSSGYLFEIIYGEDGAMHRLFCDRKFKEGHACIFWNDIYVREVISSMIRIMYAQRILMFDGFMIHASAVVRKGLAYMFLGKSGTGKSTHSRLWLSVFNDAHLLNDDNPLIRIVDGKPYVYGGPWSGKTPCFLNEKAPVSGMAKLIQYKENSWCTLTGIKAWIAVYPSCCIIREDPFLIDRLRNSLNFIACSVKIGELYCLPDAKAVYLCADNLIEKNYIL